VATEQFRSVGLVLRKEALFFVGALILVAVLVLVAVVRATHEPSAHHDAGFAFAATGAIPMILVGALLPFGVWRSEDPARRAYHWSMPVARGPHTIMKLLSGWLWLMIASIVYIVFIITLSLGMSILTGAPNRLVETPAWEWLVAFTGPTLAYLLTSIAAVGSERAWRWIGGLIVGYWVLMGAFLSFGLSEAAQLLRIILEGAAGLEVALVAQSKIHDSSLQGWLIAMPLWIIGSAIAVTIASYRHHE
jgi:hypothetical protein